MFNLLLTDIDICEFVLIQHKLDINTATNMSLQRNEIMSNKDSFKLEFDVEFKIRLLHNLQSLSYTFSYIPIDKLQSVQSLSTHTSSIQPLNHVCVLGPIRPWPINIEHCFFTTLAEISHISFTIVWNKPMSDWAVLARQLIKHSIKAMSWKRRSTHGFIKIGAIWVVLEYNNSIEPIEQNKSVKIPPTNADNGPLLNWLKS